MHPIYICDQGWYTAIIFLDVRTSEPDAILTKAGVERKEKTASAEVLERTAQAQGGGPFLLAGFHQYIFTIC
jgi:hypothetical protein